MGYPKGKMYGPFRRFVFCKGQCRTRVYYPGPDKPTTPQFCSDECRNWVAELGESRARWIQEHNKSPAEERFLQEEIARVNARLDSEQKKHMDLGDYAECAALLVALQQRIKRVKHEPQCN